MIVGIITPERNRGIKKRLAFSIPTLPLCVKPKMIPAQINENVSILTEVNVYPIVCEVTLDMDKKQAWRFLQRQTRFDGEKPILFLHYIRKDFAILLIHSMRYYQNISVLPYGITESTRI
jgi:hypothetical protein